MDGECSICLDTLLIGKTEKLSCGHYFHRSCINTWFEQKKICPLCRHKFKYSFKCCNIKYSFLKYKLKIEPTYIFIGGLFYKKRLKFEFISKVGYVKDCFIIYYKNKIIKYKIQSIKESIELFNIIRNKFFI